MKINDERTMLMKKIISLEYKRDYDLEVLKGALIASSDTLNPVKLIKNTILEVVTSPSLRQDLLKKTVMISIGYLTKKNLFGFSLNPLKKIIKSALMLIKK